MMFALSERQDNAFPKRSRSPVPRLARSFGSIPVYNFIKHLLGMGLDVSSQEISNLVLLVCSGGALYMIINSFDTGRIRSLADLLPLFELTDKVAIMDYKISVNLSFLL